MPVSPGGGTGGSGDGGGGGSSGGGSTPVNVVGGGVTLGFKVGGAVYDYQGKYVDFVRLVCYAKDGIPTLEWEVRGGLIPLGPDPFRSKTIELSIDAGTGNGSILRFAGDCWDGPQLAYVPRVGWHRRYIAKGLKARGDRFGVTNSNDGSDILQYNLDATDPDYRPELAGRTLGQILQDALDQPGNARALLSRGIGQQTSPGYGATGTVQVQNGQLVNPVATSGGTGYTTAPTVLVYDPGGGSGGSLTPQMSGGQVTGYTVAGGGSNYRNPVLVVSTLPAATLADLAALNTVPPHSVTIQGDKFLSAIEATLAANEPNFFFHVEPTGLLRFRDLRAFSSSPLTLTMGLLADRVDTDAVTINRTSDGCYPRVQLRGRKRIEVVYYESASPPGGLNQIDAHDNLSDAQARSVWKISDFNDPTLDPGQAQASVTIGTNKAISGLQRTFAGYGYTPGTTPALRIIGDGSGATGHCVMASDGYSVASVVLDSGGSSYNTARAEIDAASGAGGDAGTCTIPNSTQVVVASSQAGKVWPANYWDQTAAGRHGQVILIDPLLGGVQARIRRNITANTAKSAGGTSTLTLDSPLPYTSYSSYVIVGQAGGASQVWRKFQVADPVARLAIQTHFQPPVAWRAADNGSASLVSTPQAAILTSSNGKAPYAEKPAAIASIDRTTGIILLTQPVAQGTAANLALGGAYVTPPDSVRIMLPIAVGDLVATYPPDQNGNPQYLGTSNTVDGIAETWTVSFPTWKDSSNQANMDTWAYSLWSSVCDTRIEATIPVIGLCEAALGCGLAVNLAALGYSTGLETAALPVLECSLNLSGGKGKYLTELKASNRRAPYSAEAFARPTPTAFDMGLDSNSTPEIPSFAGEGLDDGAGASWGGSEGFDLGDFEMPDEGIGHDD